MTMHSAFAKVAIAMTFAVASAASAQSAMTKLNYNGSEVNGYQGGNASFPAEFVGTHLCEGGVSAPTANASCILLKVDGTGTWENDAGPGQRRPPASVNWYVIADKVGTVTRESTEDRDTYYIVFKFNEPYYGFKQDDLYAVPASLIKSGPRRVVVHSKWRALS